ncbi:MAG: hypothetical protein ACTSRP_08755 [Candidatus Helarchaeota archaeon]
MSDNKTVKIIIFNSEIGDQYSIKLQYRGWTFSEDHKKIIGVQFYSRELSIGNNKIHVQMWDASNMNRFKYLMPEYCSKKDGAIILFNLYDFDSFIQISEFLKFIGNRDIIIVLIGVNFITPLLKNAKKEVLLDMIDKKMEMNNIDAYFECTAGKGIIIDSAIIFIAAVALNKKGIIDDDEMRSIFDEILYSSYISKNYNIFS